MDYLKFLFILAILPAYLLCRYVYKMDKLEKESPKLIKKILKWGAISVIPAVILEMVLEMLLGKVGITDQSKGVQLFLYVLIGVACVEEGVKLFFLKKTTEHSSEFDSFYDGLLYAVFMSLGFATIENILYVFSSGALVGVIRAVLSVPGHAFFGVYMGYYYSRVKKDDNRMDKLLTYLVPVLLHTVYDFLLIDGSTISLAIFFVFIILLYIFSFEKIKSVSKNDAYIVEKEVTSNNEIQDISYCTYCGSKLDKEYAYCPNCGAKK